jgi:hypothetical protein
MQQIIRKPWPVTPVEIGRNRVFYYILATAFICYSIFIFFCNIETKYGLQDLDFKKRLIVLLWIIAIPSLIAMVIRFFIRKSNVSWLEIRNIGDKRLIKYDLITLLFCLSFSVCSSLLKFPFKYDYFVLTGLLAIGFILNATTAEDTNWQQKEDQYDDSNQDQYDTPEPSNEIILQTYRWTSGIGNFEITDFPISKVAYDNALVLNSQGPRDGYTVNNYLERAQYDPDKTVGRLASKIESTHSRKGLVQKIDNVLQFIHEPNFNYQYDEVAHADFKEYGRYPIETMVDRVGDCECLSILMCSLMKYCGFETALILLKNPAHAMGGIALPFDFPGRWVQGKTGKKYMMCEATNAGWTIGYYGWDTMELWEVLEL